MTVLESFQFPVLGKKQPETQRSFPEVKWQLLSSRKRINWGARAWGGVGWNKVGRGQVLSAISLLGPGSKVLRSKSLAASFVIQGNYSYPQGTCGVYRLKPMSPASEPTKGVSVKLWAGWPVQRIETETTFKPTPELCHPGKGFGWKEGEKWAAMSLHGSSWSRVCGPPQLNPPWCLLQMVQLVDIYVLLVSISRLRARFSQSALPEVPSPSHHHPPPHLSV